MNTKFLALSWSTSRGHETYGYNIVRLDDTQTDRRHRAMGGGYDMVGTVFGQWLQENFQDALKTIEPHVRYYPGRVSEPGKFGFYGLSWDVNQAGEVVKVRLDGGCGLESMIRIAEAVGIWVGAVTNKKGRTIGFQVGPKAP